MATTDPHEAPPRWGRRLAWLAGLWLASVATLGLLAWLLGWVLQAVGLQR
ncbi:MAG: DUF2474 family protein [Aquincola tertiaricarbonis]|nr:DUF2474 family protein [Aquincola tertiaricarbonis]